MTNLASTDEFSTPTGSLSGVEPRLFVGTFMTEQNRELLKENDITHIVQIGSELLPSHPDEFKYISVRCNDNHGADLLHILRPCLEFIDESMSSGGNTLVHCMAGVSRSPSLVIAYIMWKHQVSLEDAVQRVVAQHPSAQPNPAFLEQLKAFESEMKCNIGNLPPTPLDDILNCAGASGDIGMGTGEPEDDSDLEHNLTEEDWL